MANSPSGRSRVAIKIDPTRASIPPTHGAVTDTVTNAEKRALPYSPVGKIVVTLNPETPSHPVLAGGGTGFVVGMRTIFTAAHVVDEKRFIEHTYEEDGRTVHVAGNYRVSKIEFKPQFPLKGLSWEAREVFLHKDYKVEGSFPNQSTINLAYDFAAITTCPEDKETPIGAQVGMLGYSASTQLPKAAIGIGYPSMEHPTNLHNFDGDTMWKSSGQVWRQNPSLIYKSNDMTEGCSGGPWVVESAAGTYVSIGLNSHVKDLNDFDPMISPVFDDDFLDVLRAVKEYERNVNDGMDPSNPNYISFI